MKTYTGTILVADQPNRNGRTYSRAAVQQMVDKARMLEGFMLGEIYPDYTATDFGVKVANASHILENLELQADGSLKGTVRVLNTPSGEVLRSLLEAGAQVDLRPRGVGNVDEHGNVTDYELISIDVVNDGA